MQGPNLNGSNNDFLRTQRPVNGWKITLCSLVSDRPGPASHMSTIWLCYNVSIDDYLNRHETRKIMASDLMVRSKFELQL